MNLQIFRSLSRSSPSLNTLSTHKDVWLWIACAIICCCGLFQVPWHAREVARGLNKFNFRNARRVRFQSLQIGLFISVENYKLINWAFEWDGKTYWNAFPVNLICFELIVGKNNIHYVSIIVCGDFHEISVTSFSKYFLNSKAHVPAFQFFSFNRIFSSNWILSFEWFLLLSDLQEIFSARDRFFRSFRIFFPFFRNYHQQQTSFGAIKRG